MRSMCMIACEFRQAIEGGWECNESVISMR